MQMTAMAAIFSLQVLPTARPFDGPLAATGRAVRRTHVNDTDEGGRGQLLPALIGGGVTPSGVRRALSSLVMKFKPFDS